MNKPRVLLRIIKGMYDILATYLLAWVLFFALIAAGFYAVFEWLEAIAPSLEHRLDSPNVRVVLFSALHGAVLYGLRRPLALLQRALESGFDVVAGAIGKITRHLPSVEGLIGGLFTLVVTATLIPFVIQPTLVSRFDRASFVERAANLLDGTASVYVADSVVGFYRRLYAEPLTDQALTPDEVARAFTADPEPPFSPDPLIPPPPRGDQPMMDRWDPLLWKASEGDPRRFAHLKAFMWVESAGRQYAVSPTGCSGLMQFCAGTARSQPYRSVFGTGQVYACRCEGPCRISQATQRRLEAGDVAQVDSRSTDFPCELTDARFNPARSIKAARLYIDRLDEAYGGNLYLMYIGYNSGPAVAQKVYDALGRDPAASLDTIERHLASAMRPYYGTASEARASSLVRVHLPKLEGAYRRYEVVAPIPGSSAPP
jgi:hypothetical protein